MKTKVSLTLVSSNRKTGPIPTSYTTADTCPDVCPLKAKGCYAASGPVALQWRKVGQFGMDWAQFCQTIAGLPDGQVWRHNVAGDLPGESNHIDADALAQLVKANAGKRGFTYTHKPMSWDNSGPVAEANRRGFTVNLSGNSLAHADQLKATGAGPVVCILPLGTPKTLETPAGHKVVVCPATYREGVTCESCQLCTRAQRSVIVGFPAHGTAKRAVSEMAQGGAS